MSLPPPGLPPEVFARSRAKAVAAELGQQTDPKLQAALMFELGALAELRLGEREQAVLRYREAIQRDPSFRPALFALARQQREQRDDEALLVSLAKLAHASPNARERASILVDIGCLLEDQIGDRPGAQAAFERALEADPSCPAASLMREHALLTQPHRSAASRLVARRASHTPDPRLRSALAVEAARDLAAEGDIDAATETLLTAMAAPSRKLPILLCLAELALRHGRTWIAARAYEDIGALLAGFAADQTGPEPLEIAIRFPDRESAIQAAAYHYHAAARLHATEAAHAEDALSARERAAACAPADALCGWELAAAYRALDQTEQAQAQLRRLRRTADPSGAARLQFELAELAARQGDHQGALTYLRKAYAEAPDAPSIHAVLEDRLLDCGELKGLAALLIERADQQRGAERRTLLWRAALAAERAQDTARALGLWSSLVSASEGDERTCALRELHSVSSRAELPAQLAAAAEQLLHEPISGPERSALWRSRYEAALAQQDPVGAYATLELALSDTACDLWAPHTAWLVGGLRRDRGLLARAHDKLARLAQAVEDAPLAAAHRAAQARALLRAGHGDEALETLRSALELAPANQYAVSLLERCLLERGDTSSAIDLLRESARAFVNRSAQQVALLQAGELAEASGQLDLARQSYDEAAARDPNAFEAQWARLRFAERSRDLPRRLSALQALAARELAQRRPGNAHLELGEALAARGEPARAVAPLTAALDNESVALEAAATTLLLPRAAGAETLRVRALSELAERSSQQTRRALEHERTAELLHEHPEDARRLLAHAGGASTAAPASAAFLRFMAQTTQGEHAQAVEALRSLSADPQLQAELALHATRCRNIAQTQDDTDALLHALGMIEDYPNTLGSALALAEALDAGDDPDTRVQALNSYAQQLTGTRALALRAALARAYLDAGSAPVALRMHEELQAEASADPGHWESLRVSARVAGDFSQVVRACDELAGHLRGPRRAAMLVEAASVLHERLGQHAEAERRARAVLAELPDHQAAFERLHDILIERADLDGLLELLSTRAAISRSGAERVDLLYEKARILRARGERSAALDVIQELLAQAPSHSGGLSLSAEIQACEEDWPGAVEALRRLADADLPAAQRRLALEGCADFLEQKLGDHAGAYRELAKLLAFDLADFSVHARMADLAERSQQPLLAAQALCRAAVLSRGAQRAQLERRAAQLLLEAGEPAQAQAALERALISHPLDERAFELLLSQLSEPRLRARLARKFTGAVRQALINEPTEVELLRTLARVGHKLEDPALERLGLFALEALGRASPLELATARALRKARLTRQPMRFGDARFTRLMPRELGLDLLRLGQALSALWLELNPDPPERHGLRRRARLGANDSHLVQAPLRELLGLFGLTLGDMYVSETEPHALYPLRTSDTNQCWVVGRDLAEAQDQQLLGHVPWMAAARAGLSGLHEAEVGSSQQRARLLLCAAGLLQDERLNGEASALAPKLAQARRTQLAEVWREVARPEDAVARLSRGCALLGHRATLVIAADPVQALQALGLRAEPDALAAAPEALDLLRFWLSPDCAELLETDRSAA